MPTRFTGDLTLGAGVIRDEHIAADAAVGVAKQKHAYIKGTNFDLAIGATPVAREEVVYVANGAGTIRGFHAMLNDSGTNTDVDFDLKVNGVSVLSGVVTIVHGDGDRTVLDGTIATPALTDGDVVSIQLIVTSSTGAQGPFAWVNIAEDSAPT